MDGWMMNVLRLATLSLLRRRIAQMVHGNEPAIVGHILKLPLHADVELDLPRFESPEHVVIGTSLG